MARFFRKLMATSYSAAQCNTCVHRRVFHYPVDGRAAREKPLHGGVGLSTATTDFLL